MRSAHSYQKQITKLRQAHTQAFENGEWDKMHSIQAKLIRELNGFAQNYLDLVAFREGGEQNDE
jgi:hypothetical protein